MTRVHIPTAFRAHTDGQRHVEIDVDDIGSLLSNLTEQFPALKSYLLDESGELLSFVNVFINDENIRDRDGAASKLSGSDQVYLVPAMAGG